MVWLVKTTIPLKTLVRYRKLYPKLLKVKQVLRTSVVLPRFRWMSPEALQTHVFNTSSVRQPEVLPSCLHADKHLCPRMFGAMALPSTKFSRLVPCKYKLRLARLVKSVRGSLRPSYIAAPTLPFKAILKW
jgi:hypothetical protein